MSGLIWHKPENFPLDYDGIVIVRYDSGDENCYGTLKFWPNKGIWTLSGRRITHMAAINHLGDRK